METLPVRLVVLAPRPGSSGPAYYADRLLAEVGPAVAEVVEVRHGAAGEDTWADVRAVRDRVRAVLARPGGHRTVLHAELSGGAVAGFWSLADHPGVRRTATVHDPPRPVSFPARTAFVARHRVLHGLVHRVPERAHLALERRVTRGVAAVALSPVGAHRTRELGMFAEVTEGQLFVPEAAPLPRPAGRPRAVGLFGHVYRGKGFEELARIRAGLPEDVVVRVAGRGTESLPRLAGVEVLGGLADDELAAFFGSVRLLLLPYHPTRRGTLQPVPASLAHLTALAHDTPVLATPTLQTTALAEEGALRLAADVDGLARLAARTVDDTASLEALLAEARAWRSGRSAAAAVAPYLRLWGRP